MAVESSPDDIALITYTGGTTGTPKGVVQNQASLGVNLFAHIVAGEISASDVMLLSTPLPHSADYHLQACLLQGGQVIVRSPYLLARYFNNPDATRSTLRHGWLHTGDIGYIRDDGYLFLKDRAKDMIISGGMNVYTGEVEQALKRHPAVADAAVIGLPHADWGEQVHAVVEIRSGAEVAKNALMGWCRGKLSRYKVPKSMEFRAALPLTAYGKIDKKALRNEEKAEE